MSQHGTGGGATPPSDFRPAQRPARAMFPTLLPRVLVAAVGIPLLLGAAWLGGWWLAAAVALLSVAGLWEFDAMATSKGHPLFLWWTITVGLMIVTGQQYHALPLAAGLTAMAFLLILCLVAAQKVDGTIGRIGLTLLAVAYIPGLFVHTIALRQLDYAQGPAWARALTGLLSGRPAGWWTGHFGFTMLALTMALVWINDTAAYFTGLTMGKRRLAPAISPKKSVEGFAGGLVVTCGAAAGAHFLVLRDLPLAHAVALAAGVVLCGTLGDLFESLLKRDAGVKDSGTLLPGHGGILDRFDSLLFAVPFVYWYCRLVILP